MVSVPVAVIAHFELWILTTDALNADDFDI